MIEVIPEDKKALVKYEELNEEGEVIGRGHCPLYIIDHLRGLGKTIRVEGEE